MGSLPPDFCLSGTLGFFRISSEVIGLFPGFLETWFFAPDARSKSRRAGVSTANGKRCAALARKGNSRCGSYYRS